MWNAPYGMMGGWDGWGWFWPFHFIIPLFFLALIITVVVVLVRYATGWSDHPPGAIDEYEKRYPVFNESRCRRCGTCMGACPVRVISFENYSVDSVGSQIKAVDIPDEFQEKPRILILACENDAYPALDMAAMNRNVYSAFVRVIPVRCLGSVNTIWINDALSSGYDGVMMMGCKHGDNYQCHFVKGSEIASIRLSKIDDTLKSLNLEPERVQNFEVAITDIERVPQLINDYAAKINEIGMSPLKGFA